MAFLSTEAMGAIGIGRPQNRRLQSFQILFKFHQIYDLVNPLNISFHFLLEKCQKSDYSSAIDESNDRKLCKTDQLQNCG